MNISLLSNALQSAPSSFGETIGELTSKLLQNKVVRVVGIIFMALTALYLPYHYGSSCLNRTSAKANCVDLLEKFPILNYRLEEGEYKGDASFYRIRENMNLPVMRIDMTDPDGALPEVFYAIKIWITEKEDNGLLLLKTKSSEDSKAAFPLKLEGLTTNIRCSTEVGDQEIIRLLRTGSLEIGEQSLVIPDYAQFLKDIQEVPKG